MRKADSPAPETLPDFSRETTLRVAGFARVCGVDEAGRGPLAGPVVVSAVVLDPERIPQGLDDSKKLTAARREALFTEITASAFVSVIVAPPTLIARYNIRGATLWAMRRAVLALALRADYALVDGRDVPQGLPCPSQAVIGGDALSVSIAAASIVAKVTRDRMCQIMDCDEPAFGFASHKGYSSPAHLLALSTSGPGRHHRMDFAPCMEAAAARREAFILS